MGQGHIHDFNPGIPPSGLFWTAAVPMNDVEIDLGRVRASFHVADFPLLDTIPSPNPAATVSFDMEWSGKTADLTVKDFVNGFAGEYHECSATIEWSAQEPGFTLFPTQPARQLPGSLRSERSATACSQGARPNRVSTASRLAEYDDPLADMLGRLANRHPEPHTQARRWRSASTWAGLSSSVRTSSATKHLRPAATAME